MSLLLNNNVNYLVFYQVVVLVGVVEVEEAVSGVRLWFQAHRLTIVYYLVINLCMF